MVLSRLFIYFLFIHIHPWHCLAKAEYSAIFSLQERESQLYSLSYKNVERGLVCSTPGDPPKVAVSHAEAS